MRPRTISLVAVAGALVLSACSGSVADTDAGAGAGATGAAATSPAPPMPERITGSMAVAPDHGAIGTTITVNGKELPANAELDLLWGDVQGRYALEGQFNERYLGRIFTPVYKTLRTVRTDADGSLQTTFQLPRGFGFMHDLLFVKDGVVVNKTVVNVDMQVSLAPQEGPVGTPITISVQGLGRDKLENVWQVLYDNKPTGYLSATTTAGGATVTIPAVGAPGVHTIDVVEGPFTAAYRNILQSPHPWLRPFPFTFRVTDGEPVQPPPPAQQALPTVPGTEPAGDGPAIWIDPAAAPVGTPIVIHGRGLPAGQQVTLTWGTMVGSRVTGKGWSGQDRELPSARTGADGTFTVDTKALDDLGGPHPVRAAIGGDVVAESGFTVQPTVLGVEGRVRLTAGSPFTIHLKGVGWTETANIYTVVYDNAYVGYVCGFNSQGTVNVDLRASGPPGWHYIDLYPSTYRGEEPTQVDTFRIPQLTYQDHPGETLPAFHLAIHVEG